MNEETMLNGAAPVSAQPQEPQETLEGYVHRHQDAWSACVAELNGGLKKFSELPDLLYVVYTKRQNAWDYYFELLYYITDMEKTYRKAYADRYNYYKTNAQIRYSSDLSIKMQIEADLGEELYKIEVLKNHSEYMKETIKTIDDIIYAISNRIKIEEMINQMKK